MGQYRGRTYQCGQDTETIVFKGREYHRNPSANGKHSRRYFWGRRESGDKKKVALHVAVWEHHNGPVPDGYVVHHKDGNPLNNDVANLECVTISHHCEIHDTGRNLDGHRHKMLYSGICDQCGAEYKTWRKSKTKFCSHSCQQKHLCESRKVRRKEVRRLQSECS